YLRQIAEKIKCSSFASCHRTPASVFMLSWGSCLKLAAEDLQTADRIQLPACAGRMLFPAVNALRGVAPRSYYPGGKDCRPAFPAGPLWPAGKAGLLEDLWCRGNNCLSVYARAAGPNGVVPRCQAPWQAHGSLRWPA